MVDDKQSIDDAVNQLVHTYRARCLWFLRPDFYPSNDRERLMVLDQIERHGDREAYVKAASLRQWLSRTSSAASAGS
jgi:hypothetical protein